MVYYKKSNVEEIKSSNDGFRGRMAFCWTKLGMARSKPRVKIGQQPGSLLLATNHMSTIVEETSSKCKFKNCDLTYNEEDSASDPEAIDAFSSRHTSATSQDVDSSTLSSSKHRSNSFPMFPQHSSSESNASKKSLKSKHKLQSRSGVTKRSRSNSDIYNQTLTVYPIHIDIPRFFKRRKDKNVKGAQDSLGKDSFDDFLAQEGISSENSKVRRPSVISCILSDIFNDKLSSSKKAELETVDDENPLEPNVELGNGMHGLNFSVFEKVLNDSKLETVAEQTSLDVVAPKEVGKKVRKHRKHKHSQEAQKDDAPRQDGEGEKHRHHHHHHKHREHKKHDVEIYEMNLVKANPFTDSKHKHHKRRHKKHEHEETKEDDKWVDFNSPKAEKKYVATRQESAKNFQVIQKHEEKPMKKRERSKKDADVKVKPSSRDVKCQSSVILKESKNLSVQSKFDDAKSDKKPSIKDKIKNKIKSHGSHARKKTREVTLAENNQVNIVLKRSNHMKELLTSEDASLDNVCSCGSKPKVTITREELGSLDIPPFRLNKTKDVPTCYIIESTVSASQSHYPQLIYADVVHKNSFVDKKYSIESIQMIMESRSAQSMMNNQSSVFGSITQNTWQSSYESKDTFVNLSPIGSDGKNDARSVAVVSEIDPDQTAVALEHRHDPCFNILNLMESLYMKPVIDCYQNMYKEPDCLVNFNTFNINNIQSRENKGTNTSALHGAFGYKVRSRIPKITPILKKDGKKKKGPKRKVRIVESAVEKPKLLHTKPSRIPVPIGRKKREQQDTKASQEILDFIFSDDNEIIDSIDIKEKEEWSKLINSKTDVTTDYEESSRTLDTYVPRANAVYFVNVADGNDKGDGVSKQSSINLMALGKDKLPKKSESTSVCTASSSKKQLRSKLPLRVAHGGREPSKKAKTQCFTFPIEVDLNKLDQASSKDDNVKNEGGDQASNNSSNTGQNVSRLRKGDSANPFEIEIVDSPRNAARRNWFSRLLRSLIVCGGCSNISESDSYKITLSLTKFNSLVEIGSDSTQLEIKERRISKPSRSALEDIFHKKSMVFNIESVSFFGMESSQIILQSMNAFNDEAKASKPSDSVLSLDQKTLNVPIVRIGKINYFVFKSNLRKFMYDQEVFRMPTPCIMGHQQKALKVPDEYLVDPAPVLRRVASMECPEEEEFEVPEEEAEEKKASGESGESNKLSSLKAHAASQIELLADATEYVYVLVRTISKEKPLLLDVEVETEEEIKKVKSLEPSLEHTVPANTPTQVGAEELALPPREHVLKNQDLNVIVVKHICSSSSDSLNLCKCKVGVHKDVSKPGVFDEGISEGDDFTMSMDLYRNANELVVAFKDFTLRIVVPEEALASKSDIDPKLGEIFTVLKRNKAFIRNLHRVIQASPQGTMFGETPKDAFTNKFMSEAKKCIVDKKGETITLDGIKVTKLEEKYRRAFTDVLNQEIIELNRTPYCRILSITNLPGLVQAAKSGAQKIKALVPLMGAKEVAPPKVAEPCSCKKVRVKKEVAEAEPAKEISYLYYEPDFRNDTESTETSCNPIAGAEGKVSIHPASRSKVDKNHIVLIKKKSFVKKAAPRVNCSRLTVQVNTDELRTVSSSSTGSDVGVNESNKRKYMRQITNKQYLTYNLFTITRCGANPDEQVEAGTSAESSSTAATKSTSKKKKNLNLHDPTQHQLYCISRAKRVFYNKRCLCGNVKSQQNSCPCIVRPGTTKKLRTEVKSAEDLRTNKASDVTTISLTSNKSKYKLRDVVRFKSHVKLEVELEKMYSGYEYIAPPPQEFETFGFCSHEGYVRHPPLLWSIARNLIRRRKRAAKKKKKAKKADEEKDEEDVSSASTCFCQSYPNVACDLPNRESEHTVILSSNDSLLKEIYGDNKSRSDDGKSGATTITSARSDVSRKSSKSSKAKKKRDKKLAKSGSSKLSSVSDDDVRNPVSKKDKIMPSKESSKTESAKGKKEKKDKRKVPPTSYSETSMANGSEDAKSGMSKSVTLKSAKGSGSKSKAAKKKDSKSKSAKSDDAKSTRSYGGKSVASKSTRGDDAKSAKSNDAKSARSNDAKSAKSNDAQSANSDDGMSVASKSTRGDDAKSAISDDAKSAISDGGKSLASKSTKGGSSKSKAAKKDDSKAKSAKEDDAKSMSAKEDDAKSKSAKEDDATTTSTKGDDAKSKSVKENDAKSTSTREDDAKSKSVKEDDAKSTSTKEDDAKSKSAKKDDAKSKSAMEDDAKSKSTKENDAKSASTREDDAKSKSAKEDDAKAKSAMKVDAKAKSAMEVDAKAKSTKEDGAKAKSAMEVDAKAKSTKEDGSKAKSAKEDGAKAKSAMEVDAKAKSAMEVDAKAKSAMEVDAKAKSTKEDDAKAKSTKEDDAKAKSAMEVDAKAKSAKKDDAKAKSAKEDDAKAASSAQDQKQKEYFLLNDIFTIQRSQPQLRDAYQMTESLHVYQSDVEMTSGSSPVTTTTSYGDAGVGTDEYYTKPTIPRTVKVAAEEAPKSQWKNYYKQPVDPRANEGQTTARQPTEHSSTERQPSERQPNERQPTERQTNERQPTERQPTERQTNERQPTERQPTERQTNERQTTERQPTERQPNERQPNERQPTERQTNERQPTERQPIERQPTERQPIERQPTERQPTERQPTEWEPTEWEPTERQPTEWEPTERQPTEWQPTEWEPNEHQRESNGRDHGKANAGAEKFRSCGCPKDTRDLPGPNQMKKPTCSVSDVLGILKKAKDGCPLKLTACKENFKKLLSKKPDENPNCQYSPTTRQSAPKVQKNGKDVIKSSVVGWGNNSFYMSASDDDTTKKPDTQKVTQGTQKPYKVTEKDTITEIVQVNIKKSAAFPLDLNLLNSLLQQSGIQSIEAKTLQYSPTTISCPSANEGVVGLNSFDSQSQDVGCFCQPNKNRGSQTAKPPRTQQSTNTNASKLICKCDKEGLDEKYSPPEPFTFSSEVLEVEEESSSRDEYYLAAISKSRPEVAPVEEHEEKSEPVEVSTSQKEEEANVAGAKKKKRSKGSKDSKSPRSSKKRTSEDVMIMLTNPINFSSTSLSTMTTSYTPSKELSSANKSAFVVAVAMETSKAEVTPEKTTSETNTNATKAAPTSSEEPETAAKPEKVQLSEEDAKTSNKAKSAVDLKAPKSNLKAEVSAKPKASRKSKASGKSAVTIKYPDSTTDKSTVVIKYPDESSKKTNKGGTMLMLTPVQSASNVSAKPTMTIKNLQSMSKAELQTLHDVASGATPAPKEVMYVEDEDESEKDIETNDTATQTDPDDFRPMSLGAFNKLSTTEKLMKQAYTQTEAQLADIVKSNTRILSPAIVGEDVKEASLTELALNQQNEFTETSDDKINTSEVEFNKLLTPEELKREKLNVRNFPLGTAYIEEPPKKQVISDKDRAEIKKSLQKLNQLKTQLTPKFSSCGIQTLPIKLVITSSEIKQKIKQCTCRKMNTKIKAEHYKKMKTSTDPKIGLPDKIELAPAFVPQHTDILNSPKSTPKAIHKQFHMTQVPDKQVKTEEKGFFWRKKLKGAASSSQNGPYKIMSDDIIEMLTSTKNSSVIARPPSHSKESDLELLRQIIDLGNEIQSSQNPGEDAQLDALYSQASIRLSTIAERTEDHTVKTVESNDLKNEVFEIIDLYNKICEYNGYKEPDMTANNPSVLTLMECKRWDSTQSKAETKAECVQTTSVSKIKGINRITDTVCKFFQRTFYNCKSPRRNISNILPIKPVAKPSVEPQNGKDSGRTLNSDIPSIVSCEASKSPKNSDLDKPKPFKERKCIIIKRERTDVKHLDELVNKIDQQLSRLETVKKMKRPDSPPTKESQLTPPSPVEPEKEDFRKIMDMVQDDIWTKLKYSRTINQCCSTYGRTNPYSTEYDDSITEDYTTPTATSSSCDFCRHGDLNLEMFRKTLQMEKVLNKYQTPAYLDVEPTRDFDYGTNYCHRQTLSSMYPSPQYLNRSYLFEPLSDTTTPVEDRRSEEKEYILAMHNYSKHPSRLLDHQPSTSSSNAPCCQLRRREVGGSMYSISHDANARYKKSDIKYYLVPR